MGVATKRVSKRFIVLRKKTNKDTLVRCFVIFELSQNLSL